MSRFDERQFFFVAHMTSAGHSDPKNSVGMMAAAFCTTGLIKKLAETFTTIVEA